MSYYFFSKYYAILSIIILVEGVNWRKTNVIDFISMNKNQLMFSFL